MKVYNSSAVYNSQLDIKDKRNIDKDGFLKILSAQLQNQDPMNAGDNTQYVAQMAQFAALEQMQNLNTSMNNLLLSQKVNEANMLIGKVVKVDTGEDGYITGEVSSIKTGNGRVNIVIDNSEYDVNDVVEVIKNDTHQNQIKEILEEILENQKSLLDDTENTVVEGCEENVVQNN